MTLMCTLTQPEDLPRQVQDLALFQIRCPQGTCSIVLCWKGPLVALTFISQLSHPRVSCAWQGPESPNSWAHGLPKCALYAVCFPLMAEQCLKGGDLLVPSESPSTSTC